jgi:hypothetical protein
VPGGQRKIWAAAGFAGPTRLSAIPPKSAKLIRILVRFMTCLLYKRIWGGNFMLLEVPALAASEDFGDICHQATLFRQFFDLEN